ncbi:BREX-1 system adenine-specific DNA-methyltransferase PglX [Paenibacillus sp. RUD330]|nr:BREX-1 system adenine-specific DNA-methyltransferase PglX [Paenibacillus sp. RUD330]
MERSAASMISAGLEKSAKVMAKFVKTNIGAKNIPAELKK